MADQKISSDNLISLLTSDIYFPAVDPNQVLAENRNIRITFLQLAAAFMSAQSVTSTPVTLTTTQSDRLIVLDSGSGTVNLPATPVEGLWYVFKNISGSTKTIAGNGNNIFTSSAASSMTLLNGISKVLRWDGTYWLST